MIELNPKYTPIHQIKYCCVPACISMVLNRHLDGEFDQKEIGYELGLTVPPEYLDQFPGSKDNKPSSGYGTQVQNEKYSINSFFKRQNLPFEESYFLPKTVEDLENFIIENIDKNFDQIICFNYKKVYGKGNNGGHVSLIQSYDQDSGTIELLEPADHDPKFKKVNIKIMFDSIILHGESNYGGIWLIKKINLI